MANHKITIDVEARFKDSVSSQSKAASKSIEGVEKAAEGAQKELNKLGKKKANPKIDVDDRATKKINKAEKLLSKLKHMNPSVHLKAVDKATAVINKIKNAAKGLTGKVWQTAVKIKDYATAPLTKLKNTLFSIKSLVLAITAGLAAKQFVLNPISLADQYSSAKIGFSTLLGGSAGQKMMNDLDAFAKATPFKSSQVIAQTQRMIAMGWDAENIIKDMTTIGDAAAATGKGEQGLQQIVTALAQIKTKGKLSTEELNQLAEAGVSAKRYIAEGLGYGSGDAGIAAMTKDLENGAIASDKALTALLEGMKEYNGMMDRTANETVEGLKSQLEDTFEINILRRWGQGLQDGAKRGFGEIVTLLDEADGALGKFGDTIYDIGKAISNWAADKLENTIKRITEITDSYEFRNASLGEKISMLWNGVIVDPLKEWWEGGGQQKTAESAGKIGSWMGEMLTKGLLALFGATDVLDESIGTNAGSSIAGSFLQGFLDNFDGQAITDAFVDAIGNVWGALPTWAKVLVGGYGAGKVAGGISSFGHGIASFLGGAGAVIGSSVAMTGLLGFGANTAINLGAGNLAGGASLGGAALSALGLAGTAGGIAGGASLIKGGIDLYGSYKAFRNGDNTEGTAKAASGGSAVGGVAAGAAAGAAIGSIIPGLGTAVGALVGAGVGGIAGWFAGNKWADNIRKTAAEAKYEVEGVAEAMENAATEEEKLAALSKAAWENMRRHMGGIKLSAAEIETLAKQIVWGDEIQTYETFTSAVQTATESLKSMKNAAESTNRWMFKAALGAKFSEDDIEAIGASVDEYINSAKTYVENKHYEFSAAVSLLVDPEGSKSIMETGNAFYTKLQEQLNSLGSELSGKVSIALEDGVITLNEHQEIVNLQQQIAEITEKVSSAETKAELELIRVKFGKGNMDLDSFDTFIAQMETTLNERISASDEAFTASVASLNLQLAEGAITEAQYNEQLNALTDGYSAKIETLKADVMGLELDIIGDAYKDVLGADSVAKLQKAIETSLNEGLDPKDWSVDDAKRLLGIDDLKDDTAAAITAMIGEVSNQIKLMNPAQKISDAIPSSINKTITVNLTAVTGSTRVPFDLQVAQRFRGGIVGGSSSLEGFAQGGMVRGGSKLIKVAEEGSPEMIIPLSSQRRDRGLKLWAQAGEMLGVGQQTGSSIRNNSFRTGGAGGVQIDIGGVTVQVNVDANGTANVAEAIKAQAAEIAETVAGALADALSGQFENTPAKGGIA